MSRRDRLARVAETAAALRAAQAAHDNALLDARDAPDRATLEELGKAIGIPRQTVRWRIRAARRDTGCTTITSTDLIAGTENES